MKPAPLAVLAGGISLAALVAAQPFQLPTANGALFERSGEERFFVGTPGKSWEAGTFGCVRSDGHQLHEGLDIRGLKRDKRGEPADLVLATADGVVVYVNRRPTLSNYGNYVVLQHRVEGLDLYSLYAHLREARAELKPGLRVRARQVLGVMGRTSNTRSGISKDRAHVHFELDLRLSDHFAAWRRLREPHERNDHDEWNGQNLLGLDAAQMLREQARLGARFSLRRFLRDQTELCRVQVRATDFSWLKRYAPLIETNPRTVREGVAGYDLALNYCGLPFRLIPRAPAEMRTATRFHLLSVNEREQAARPCRNLMVKRGGVWALGHNGERLLDLLTY